MSKGGGPNVAEYQQEIEMLKKVVADKDTELAALREQLDAKDDAMNRLEAEVLCFQIFMRFAPSCVRAGGLTSGVARARAEHSL